MTLIDNFITLKDKLDAIPVKLGLPSYRRLEVHRLNEVYLVVPDPKVISIAGPGTSVPGVSDFGVPGSTSMGNITVRTTSLLVYVNRSNSLVDIFSDDIKYYVVDGQKYQALSVGDNNPLMWELMLQRRVDQR